MECHTRALLIDVEMSIPEGGSSGHLPRAWHSAWMARLHRCMRFIQINDAAETHALRSFQELGGGPQVWALCLDC